MKIHGHRLVQADGKAAPFAVSPNIGDADKTLAKLFDGSVDGRPALVVSEGIPHSIPPRKPPPVQQGGSVSHSHGGFDNDCATMNSVLTRVLGNAAKRPFSGRDLHY